MNLKIVNTALIIVIMFSCSRETLQLPDPILKEGESINYFVEYQSLIDVTYKEANEKAVTSGSYDVNFKNIGHIVMIVTYKDVTIDRNGQKMTVGIENLLSGSPLAHLLNPDTNTIEVNFYGSKDGVIDMDYYNEFLSMGFTNQTSAFNGNVLSTLTSDMSTKKKVLLKKGKQVTVKTDLGPDKSGHQELNWVVKSIDDKFVNLRCRGFAKYPPFPGADHKIEGNILISEKINKLTGITEDITYTAKAHGPLIAEAFEEPALVNVDINFNYERTR